MNMYKVMLKNNETSEQRTIPMNLDWHEASEFWWTEGNMACDCNRHDIFNDAQDDGIDCGDYKYTAICAILDTGERIALDDL
jgi:hypothetical protein